ncbi:CFI-box-CTERM domain-containing protein [Hyphomonas sp.]|uniref:CFI-box-CTERM domain-containing protein n=1 Tax=Hyphomonas sp. TaxID=87 RepID=UPI0039187BB3
MKQIRKRTAAALALLGLVPAASLAQAETPVCREETKLSNAASVITEIRRNSFDETVAHRVFLQPETASPERALSFEAGGPVLVYEMVFTFFGGTLNHRSQNAIISDIPSRWPCATLKIDNHEFEQSCVRDASGSISFYGGWYDMHVEDSAILLTLIGDTEADRAVLQYDRSMAAFASGQFARTRAVDLANRYIGRECTPIPVKDDCFLTTATCGVIGLADDCWELRTLRRFRDGWLARQPGGAADIARYYDEAPQIARRLRRDPASAVREYWRFILPSALAASLGANRAARALYTRGMNRLAAAHA